MTARKKQVFLWSMVAAAPILHVLFCEWIERTDPWSIKYVTYLPRHMAKVFSVGDLGLYVDSEASGSFGFGIFLGVVVPIGLIVAARFLQLRWFPGALIWQAADPGSGGHGASDSKRTKPSAKPDGRSRSHE